ncbi:MAG: ribonuclease HII [Pseudomonadales bacterium]|nr:MAG: ribonuclease HII [Pseudomonadales bacterium]
MIINETYKLNDILDELVFTEQQAEIKIQGKINLTNLTKIDPNLLQIGIDEAGRGPLLGSVVVGAVLLPSELTGELEKLDLSPTPLTQLNDSKKISEKKRNAIYQKLQEHAVAYVSVDMPAQVIDEINILQASLQGMRLAVRCLLANISKHIQPKNFNVELLFDGNKLPKLDFSLYQQWGYDNKKIAPLAVVKGDSKFTSIASASIIAKVERDEQMYQLAKQYPQYGIEQHKGYPTKAHFLALEEFGIIKNEHRQSFAPVRKLITQKV